MTREHPRRRRLAIIRHAEPAEALEAMLEPDTGTQPAVLEGCTCPTLRPGEECPAHPFDASQYVPAAVVSRETTPEPAVGPFVAGGQVPAADSTQDQVSALVAYVAALQEAPPALSLEHRLKLEALTAQWVRDVRTAPGPDDTLLVSAPSSRPPVPPARPAAVQLEPPAPAPLPQTPEPAPVIPEPAPVPAGPATRVTDWTGRHDPRSLQYAVRRELRTPVPLQDVLLDHGPILDQGTTPPLSHREASGCVGMAVTAAANVLDLQRLGAGRLALEDAREAYELAQRRDHITGEDYAGTSVLAGMKAGQELGWWDTYLWTLGGTKELAQVLLQLRAPVVVGLPWSTGLESPDRDGVIAPGGTSVGGHALAVIGLERSHRGRPGWWFVLQQSRGEAEGLGGLVRLHHRHLGQLLAGVGEAAVPMPRWRSS